MPFAFRTTQTSPEKRNDGDEEEKDENDDRDDPLPQVPSVGNNRSERRNLDCESKLMLRKLNCWGRRDRVIGALRGFLVN